MSSYPKWWETTITIYNRYEDPTTNVVSWYSHVVKGCFWDNRNQKTVIGQTVIDSNSNIVRIREDNKFATYPEWIRGKQESHFTLHQGDILVKGEVDEVIDEYTKGQHSTDFIAKYKDYAQCITVATYKENIGAGRVYPHYYVIGE